MTAKLIGNATDIGVISANVVEIEKHFHNHEKWFGAALEDGGYEIAGTTLPDFDGSYFKTGTQGGDSAYTNRDGNGFLWWDGVDSWIVSAILGTEGTDYFKRTDPSQIGAYTNQGSATGTVTGADIVDEDHVADRLTLTQTSFVADAGNDDWGSWLQVLGSDDTPVRVIMTKFDFHKILVVSHEHNTTEYDMQIVCGESAGIAAKLIVEDFTEITMVTGAGNSETGPTTVKQTRIDVGDKIWVRIRANTKNTGTLDFKIGIHEYVE